MSGDTPLTFHDWLQRFHDSRSPRGDLARDAAADPEFPRDVRDADTLLDYLQGHGACEGAMAAAEKAWSQFAEEART